MSVLKLRVICPRPDLRQRTLSHTMSSSFCPSFVSSFCTRTLGGPTWLLLAPNDDQHPDNPNPGNRGAVRAVRRAASPVRFSGRQTFPLPDKGRFCAVQAVAVKARPCADRAAVCLDRHRLPRSPQSPPGDRGQWDQTFMAATAVECTAKAQDTDLRTPVPATNGLPSGVSRDYPNSLVFSCATTGLVTKLVGRDPAHYRRTVVIVDEKTMMHRRAETWSGEGVRRGTGHSAL